MKEYLGKYKGGMLFVCLVVFLIHGSKLNSAIVGIDTEDLIHLQNEFYGGWLATGRQGLVFLKWLMGAMEFNPYFAGLMTLIFLAAGTTAFLFLWSRESGQGCGVLWMSCAFLWLSHPVLVEQFYFSLQSAEICIGMLITAAALWMVRRASEMRRMRYNAAAVILLLVSFSIYQIFVVMFIFGAVSLLLLKTLCGDGKKSAYNISEIFPYAGVFIAAFVSNSLITAAFFNKSNYLNGQVKWGNIPVRECVYCIAMHVRDVLTGQNSIFYGKTLGILLLFGLVLVFFLMGKYGFRLMFYYVSLTVTPFLMTLVCADAPVIRSQLVLPALTGFLAYLDIYMLSKIRTAYPNQNMGETKNHICMRMAYVLIIFISVVGGLAQMQMSLRLYYTDACRYEEDVAIARAIIKELEPLIGSDETPVAVVGSRSFKGNNACVKGEMIGRSIFEHDVDLEPQYYWSTRRVIGFFHTLGYDCEQLYYKNMPYACEFAEDMDVWPGKRSVAHAGDMVVIKLSE